MPDPERNNDVKSAEASWKTEAYDDALKRSADPQGKLELGDDEQDG